MSTRDLAWAAVALALVGCASATVTSAPVTETPNLGHTATPAQIAGWDISIQPDGGGLPSGNGTPAKGAVVYEQKCQACHGVRGAGQPNDRLVGGQGTPASPTPERPHRSYWAYGPTLFLCVRRALPAHQ